MKLFGSELQDFIRFGHPYRKALVIVLPMTIVAFLIAMIFIFPKADTTSIQSGLTLAGETIGVLFSLVLVIVVVLLDQAHRSNELIRKFYNKYRHLLDTKKHLLSEGIREYKESIEAQKLQIDDPIWFSPNTGAVGAKHREILGKLVGLMVAVDSADLDSCEKILDGFEFDEEDKGRYLYSEGVVAANDPVTFLDLMNDALTPIVSWQNEEIEELTIEVFDGFTRDGVSDALGRLERANNVIRSSILAIDLTFLSITTIGTVLLLFGASDLAMSTPGFRGVISLLIAGFIISVLLTLLLIEKIF